MEATGAMQEADELRRASDRIARLLDELRELATPPAWQRVEQLVRTMVELYGGGLARVIDHAGAASGGDDLRERLVADELVASLLTLHGLHPLAPDERIRRALAACAAELGTIELRSLDDGVARLAQTSLGASRLSPPQLLRALERLVGDVAPEVARVELDGVRAPPPAGPSGEPLVQIDVTRGRRP